MKVPYLKNASEIEIVAWPIVNGKALEGKLMPLGVKIIEYWFGQENRRERVMALIEELLVKGELTVTEPSRNERLALADSEDRTTRGQARSLFEDFLEEASTRQQEWSDKA